MYGTDDAITIYECREIIVCIKSVILYLLKLKSWIDFYRACIVIVHLLSDAIEIYNIPEAC